MKVWENESGKMQRCMEKISPAIARDLTENNAARLAKYNLVARPIHPALVRQYMSAIKFLQQFKDGSNAERTSPALQIRRKIKKYSRNANNKELLAKMFFVINAVIDDRRVNTLKPDWSFRLSDGVRWAR